MFRFLAVLGLCAALTARGQNNALAQLQAKGVTESGGNAAYAHYIVRLGSDGKVAGTMLPAGLSDTCYSRLLVVDAINGSDTADNAGGSVRQPYKTLQWATRQLPQRRAAGTAYYLVPGSYGATALDPGYSPGATNIIVCGASAASTYISELNIYTASSGVVRVTVELAGVRVGVLRMQNNRPVTLRLSQGAGVDEINTSYASAFTVHRSPDNSIGAYSGSGVYSNALTHSAADVYYFSEGKYTNLWTAMDAVLEMVETTHAVTPADTQRWNLAWASVPTTVVAYATAVDATNRVAALEARTNVWNKVTELWSTNTADGHEQWLGLEVAGPATNVVMYEIVTTYEVQAWMWYVAGGSSLQYYDEGSQTYPYAFNTESDRQAPGLPRLLSTPATVLVDGDSGTVTVGSGSGFYGGTFTGVGIEATGQGPGGMDAGIVLENPDYEASLYVWNSYNYNNTSYNLYMGDGVLYRVDEAPVKVVTTNTLMRCALLPRLYTATAWLGSSAGSTVVQLNDNATAYVVNCTNDTALTFDTAALTATNVHMAVFTTAISVHNPALTVTLPAAGATVHYITTPAITTEDPDQVVVLQWRHHAGHFICETWYTYTPATP